MARPPRPWYDSNRDSWYVTIDGQRHNLGKHQGKKPVRNKKTGLWNPPKFILDEFHKLVTEDHPKVSNESIAAIMDDFIAWCHENRAPRTASGYQDFCQKFVDKYGRLPVSKLHSGHVTTWLKDYPQWNSTTKNNAIRAIVRAMNWAVRNRGLSHNPIARMEKPKPQTRTAIITQTEFDELLKHVKEGDPFRDLLIVSFDSFARPFEIKDLRADQIQLAKCRAVIHADEAKKGITRAIYFPTERSMEIIKRLVEEHAEGPIFRNTRGAPWTAYSVHNRFDRLQEKVGKLHHQYAFRRGGITRAIINGVDSHVVAKLAGHTTTKMIDDVYSVIADDHDFMLKSAKRASGTSDEE